MANQKISQLTSGAPAQATDIVPIDRAGANFSLQVSDILAAAKTGILFAAAGNTDTVNAPNNTTTAFSTSYNLPANYLTAGRVIRITLGFVFVTTDVPTMNLALFMGPGPTTVWASVPLTSGNNATRWGGVTILIQGTAAAGASVAVYAHPIISPGTSSGALVPIAGGNTSQPVNLPTNGILAITPALFASSSTAGNSVTLQQMIVEALN
jgi:hypothetical protein